MENVTKILYAVARGFIDSLRGAYVIFYLDKEMNQRSLSKISPNNSQGTPKRRQNNPTTPTKTIKQFEESKVLKRTIQCGFLNGGIFLLSILLFQIVMLPGIRILLTIIFGEESSTGRKLWSWMEPILSLTFGTIWVLPLFFLSKVINCLWFQDIADSAYRYSRGRPQFMSSVSKLIADSLFSILVQALFLAQSMLVSLIPLMAVGEVLCLIHMCLLYSLYAFEYKWFNMGWELHKRLTFIEHNWPYFIGFGLPLAVLTQLQSSYFISGCMFSILFPFFIISGNEANPVTDVCDYPLQLFSPVIAISNSIFNHTISGHSRSIEPTPIRR